MRKKSMKKALSWFLAVAIAFTCSSVSFGAAETVFADDAIAISDAAGFANMAADGNYILESDIAIDAPYATAFTGTFDGNGHTITVSTGSVFSTVSGGTVQNLVVEGDISTTGNVGGVASISNGSSTFYRCVNKANITTTSRSGRSAGIVSNATGPDNATKIIECVNLGNMTNTGAAGIAAGIVAYDAGTVQVDKCYNMGSITAKSKCAGIKGQVGSSVPVTNCYNIGTLTGGSTGTGEILGWNNAAVGAVNCYWTGSNQIQGGGAGVPEECEQVADAAALLAKLSAGGYVADSANINGGFPVLAWQGGSTGGEGGEGTDPGTGGEGGEGTDPGTGGEGGEGGEGTTPGTGGEGGEGGETPEGPTVDVADQEVADALKAKFDGETGALRPVYGTDASITNMVAGKMAAYTGIEGLDPSKLSVAVKSSSDADIIAADGTINYIKADQWTMSGVYSKNVPCEFTVTYGTATVDTASRTITVGWDRAYFASKMQAEADALTEDAIKGSNADLTAVESDLSLPRCMGTNARQVWSEIEWTTSDASVLSLKQEEYTGITTPLTGKVTPQEFDKEVTVTATFKANENILNSYTERPTDMGTITKSFTVTVKGTGIHEYTEAELKAVLDQYYTADMLQSFEDKKPLDRDNCKGDIQLPRYTKITDAEGNLVFENKEIAVTSSDESVIKINGYRAIVDRFQSGDKDVNLTVTFTRNGTSVSTVIPVKVIAVDESELDAELAKMELAKENYFKGLNDGRYASEAEITGDLHAFQEMNVDEEGNISWVYSYDEMTNTGIIPDGYFEDSWEMEAAGYNKFKTSDNSVLAYENLVYTAPAQDTDVTITSWLSSEKFGDFAPAHPENEKLQKLYKQEVSVKVTVLAPHTHMLIHYAAKDPSYSAAGNTEYWECKDCGKCFSDEAATARIEKADTVIAKLVREAAKEGTVLKAGANYYQVAASTGGTPVVYLKSTTAKKKCTVPATITSNSVTYKVIGISSGAFKGKKKLRTIYIKNKNLTKASVKGSLSGSKVRTVKIRVGSKALNKNYVKLYKPFFAKSNSGKKVRVRR